MFGDVVVELLMASGSYASLVGDVLPGGAAALAFCLVLSILVALVRTNEGAPPSDEYPVYLYESMIRTNEGIQ